MQAAAKVPAKARSKRGAHIVRQMSELCALDAEELHPPSSAGGSNASTQYDTPASKRAKLDDAPDAAHDSVASGVEPPGVPSGDVASDSLPSPASEDPTTTGMPPPTGPPPSGVSLPHVNLHIIIPSNPATPVEDPHGKPASASARSKSSLPSLSSPGEEEDERRAVPVTPATAPSVLPLHAAVAAGREKDVLEWLDKHAPMPPPPSQKEKSAPSPPSPRSAEAAVKAAHEGSARAPLGSAESPAVPRAPGGGGAAASAENDVIPEWPPRPVPDVPAAGPGSESGDASLPPFESARGFGGSSSPPVRDALASADPSTRARSPRASVDARNEHGNTALAVAAALPDASAAASIASALLARGASPLALSGGWSPAHWAAHQGNAEAIGVLCAWEGGRATDCRAADTGDTPLMVAAASGRIECCERLVALGADVGAVNADGVGALRHAASRVSRRDRAKSRAATRAALLRAAPSLRTLILHHDDCGRHVSFKPHQESPERIGAILERLLLSSCASDDPNAVAARELEVSADFEPAGERHLARCHSEEYIAAITELGRNVANTPVAFTPYYQGRVKGVPAGKQKKPEFSDTFFAAGTMAAALRAAGAVVHAVESVLTGKNSAAFACVRPPGHHAGVDGATAGAPSSGFSILNNAMIGAMHALEHDGGRLARRVAVVDFDVHHGNGTEEIAKAWHSRRRAARLGGVRDAHRSDLFFASIHLADDGAGTGIEFYPGTGVADDLRDNVVNVTVPPMWRGGDVDAASGAMVASVGAGGRKRVPKRNRDDELDGSGVSLAAAKAAEARERAALTAAMAVGGREEWMKRLRERVLPPLRAFEPDLLILSAGFDAARGDVGNAGVNRRGQRVAGINLSPEDYEEMTARLCGVANACGAKVVSVLEGGYGTLAGNPSEGAAGLAREGLARCVVAHVRALAGLTATPSEG